MKQAFLLLITLIGLNFYAHGQEEIISNIGVALKASSAKELVKYCHTTLEIQIDGVSKTYNKTQSEIVLKSFFDKNPASDFRYIHQGSSAEGYQYTIGKYAMASGSYRVYYLLKKGTDTYSIHTISFSKE